MIYALGQHSPTTLGEDYFIAPSATVIGRVTLGAGANVWFGAVLRGDSNVIVIGDGSNIQDTAVVHVDHDAPATIGANVTVGHGATVHGCNVGDRSLVGIGATILSHAVIGKDCIVGAGALVTERKQFPDRSLIVGVPARLIRCVTDEELKMLIASAEHYVELGRRYKSELQLQK
jgi:carbonic anhydrase/acetyltransferase-like protein (isoleucine patch superfamily)